MARTANPKSIRNRPLTTAEAELMDRHRRLAWWAAERYARRLGLRNTDRIWDDAYDALLDACIFGLSIACKQYRPERGAFSTFATTVMALECSRLLERGGLDHLHEPTLSLSWDGEEGTRTFAEMLPDENAVDPLHSLGCAALTRIMDAVCATLSEREHAVVRSYFFGGRTLREIAAMQGLTRQRIAQIKASALAKLRQVLIAQGVSCPAESAR